MYKREVALQLESRAAGAVRQGFRVEQTRDASRTMCVARLFARIQCKHTIRILNTISRSRPRRRDGEAGDFDGVPGATGIGPIAIGSELRSDGLHD